MRVVRRWWLMVALAVAMLLLPAASAQVPSVQGPVGPSPEMVCRQIGMGTNGPADDGMRALADECRSVVRGPASPQPPSSAATDWTEEATSAPASTGWEVVDDFLVAKWLGWADGAAQAMSKITGVQGAAPAGDDAHEGDQAPAVEPEIERVVEEEPPDELPAPPVVDDVPTGSDEDEGSASVAGGIAASQVVAAPVVLVRGEADASLAMLLAYLCAVAWLAHRVLCGRWRFLPVVGLFTRLRRDELMDHARRKDIVRLVESAPGIHFSAIVRRLGLGHGQAEMHLQRLVQGGILVEVRDAGYACYFSDRALAEECREGLPALKSRGARGVLCGVVSRGQITTMELARRTQLTRQAVSYHLRRLVERGLVQRVANGGCASFSPTAQGVKLLEMIDDDHAGPC